MKKIFICYSQKDAKSKERLETHLKFFEKQGQLTYWSDTMIKCGSDWDPEIIKTINEACAAILLISADFLASDYIQDKELPHIFQRRQTEGMKVFPFILFECNWKEHQFIPAINARPQAGKPLHSLRGKNAKEEAFTKFTGEIKSILSSELSIELKEDVESDSQKESITLIEKIRRLKGRFYPLTVLKPNFLMKLHPFNEIVNPKQRHFLNKFSLHLANDELAESIKKWNDNYLGNISTEESKIIQFLKNNLITRVTGIKTKEFELHESETKCSCIICAIDKLDFKLIDSRLATTNNNLLVGVDIDEQLEYAYANYRLYNFVEAYKQLTNILEAVKDEPNQDKKTITEFICKSNLQNLYWMFVNTKFEQQSQEVLKELKEPKFYNYLSNENLDEHIFSQLEYISNGRFLKDISNKIDKSLNSINSSVEVNQNVQIHIEELLYQVSYLTQFTRKNYLFYENFDDYYVIIEKALDGIFSAYSVQNNIPSLRIIDRLGSWMKFEIDEFILNLCIFHCNTDTLLRIFRRYNIKELVGVSDVLVDKALNFFDSSTNFDKYTFGNTYRYLFRKFNYVTENLFYLISYSEESERLHDLLPKIINVIKSSGNRFEFKGFKYLLVKKGKYFGLKELQGLLEVLLEKYDHEEYLIQLATNLWHKYFEKNKIDGDTSIALKVLSSENKHLLFYFWFIGGDNLKSKTKRVIEDSLRKRFNFRFFFNYGYNEIINYELYLEEAITYLRNSKNKGLFEKVGDKYITDDYNEFNYFIEMFYKFNIQLPTDFKEVFKIVSDYHEFLLNPEEFDYNKFDTEWLFVFQREDYWNKFKTIEKLKDAVKNTLAEKYSDRLAEFYYKRLNN